MEQKLLSDENRTTAPSQKRIPLFNLSQCILYSSYAGFNEPRIILSYSGYQMLSPDLIYLRMELISP